jgi:dephospho-CoA kinase
LAANQHPHPNAATEILVERGIHISETAWVGTKFDAIIDNNGTMDHLYQQINDLVPNLQAAKASQF